MMHGVPLDEEGRIVGPPGAVPVPRDAIRRMREAAAKAAAEGEPGDPRPPENMAGEPDGGAPADSTSSGAGEVEADAREAAPIPRESGEDDAADVPALGGQEVSADVGAGPANGTEAAGGIPDFGDYPLPAAPARKAGNERDRAVEEMKEEARAQIIRVCNAAATSIDMVEKAVGKALEQIERKVPSIDSRDMADLVVSVRQFEEHFRAVKADETRRRDLSAARRRYRWPLRGLVVAVVVALLLAGAAGQARWGLIDGYGVVDAATNGWRQVVWSEHGWKIANCMKTAHDRNPKAVCSVTARVK